LEFLGAIHSAGEGDTLGEIHGLETHGEAFFILRTVLGQEVIGRDCGRSILDFLRFLCRDFLLRRWAGGLDGNALSLSRL